MEPLLLHYLHERALIDADCESGSNSRASAGTARGADLALERDPS